MSLGERRAMIAPSHPRLSVVRQCALVGLYRSGVYYRPKGESAATLALMRVIDEVFLEHPFYGARQMMLHLRRLGQRIGRHYNEVRPHSSIGNKVPISLTSRFVAPGPPQLIE